MSTVGAGATGAKESAPAAILFIHGDEGNPVLALYRLDAIENCVFF
jgi:hypothetical protein